MGQVTSMGKVKAQNRVPRLEASQHHSGIGGRTRMRLHICPSGPKQLAQPVDGQALGLVHKFTAPIVALARQALGILVREDASLCGHHGLAGVVFRSDQFGAFDLPNALALHNGGHLGIALQRCQGSGGSWGGCGHVHVDVKSNLARQPNPAL